MKTSSIIVIIVGVVIIYLAYRFFFSSNSAGIKSIVPSTGPVHTTPGIASNVNLDVDVNATNCNKLVSQKTLIDDLDNQYKYANNDVINGYAITRAGTITDPVELQNRFLTAQYNYNNEVIKYNSSNALYNCGYADIIPVVYKSTRPINQI